MKMPRQTSGKGFTLLELMVAMALGMIVMAAMASLFKMGMDSTMMVTQRAETQQNMRAAIDLMVKDISMAGAGLPSGGIQLPTGGGATTAKFGCDQGGTCYVPAYTYPAGNYMYGIIPGYLNGVQGSAVIPAAPGQPNDSITVIYADYNFPLWEYNVTFPTAPDGTSICLTANTTYAPAPALPNSSGGIQKGDLILINGTNGQSVVGEATNVSATTISFANTDPLNFNYSKNGSTTNNVYAASSNTGYTCPPPVTNPQTTQGTAYRLFAVTYYLTVPGAGQTPRLMRQVNGLTPVPVADDIINLQFAYDTYNSTTNALDPTQPNPIGVGESPNLIQKINVVLMGQSIINHGNRSQNLYLATSVSARDMAFRNRYQ
ncbi:MAG TPA: prepilin-type N-terminal cleavage/methylation domain-containing protein [Verrucomicrobiae bacterium]|nr:prepilin-type N-terminal cleavage/methylation domain-containing protein [Verrucomicrobiae bacterium]